MDRFKPQVSLFCIVRAFSAIDGRGFRTAAEQRRLKGNHSNNDNDNTIGRKVGKRERIINSPDLISNAGTNLGSTSMSIKGLSSSTRRQDWSAGFDSLQTQSSIFEGDASLGGNMHDLNARQPRFQLGQMVNATVMHFVPTGVVVSISPVSLTPHAPSKSGGTVVFSTGIISNHELTTYREATGHRLDFKAPVQAYVSRQREDGRVDLLLRPPVVDRVPQVAEQVLEALERYSAEAASSAAALLARTQEWEPGSAAAKEKSVVSETASARRSIPVGDKSSPADISSFFYGVTKQDFKMVRACVCVFLQNPNLCFFYLSFLSLIHVPYSMFAQSQSCFHPNP